MAIVIPAWVIAVSFFLSVLSARIQPIGETIRYGSIDANVNKPTKTDLSDSESTYHWLAIKNVHVLAPPSAFAPQMYLKSRLPNAAKCGGMDIK